MLLAHVFEDTHGGHYVVSDPNGVVARRREIALDEIIHRLGPDEALRILLKVVGPIANLHVPL